MKLTIYNGSPRGKVSNSQKIGDVIGAQMDSSIVVAKHCLKNTKEHESIVKEQSDAYLFVFPLYTDLMPYAVKAFLEKMEESKEIYKDKPLYFFVHSGFPEAKQSRILERYLRYFCTIIDAKCMGVCIMGNSEGTRHLDNESKKMIKLKENMQGLSDDMANNKVFNQKSIEYFKGMETLPKAAINFMKVIPVINIGFNLMIKKHGPEVYKKRFDKPYQT